MIMKKMKKVNPKKSRTAAKKSVAKKKAIKKSRTAAVNKELSKLNNGKPTRSQKMAKVAAKKRQQSRALSGAMKNYTKRVKAKSRKK